MKKFLTLFILTATLFSCKTTVKKQGLITQNAIVVSAREEASTIGSDILKQGGNAFDAMVATQLALAVAYPYAGNLGGGGFMVYRKANDQTGTLDFREKAPQMATRDMYLDSLGNVIPEKSTLGAMAVGVPGTVAGVFAVHDKLGSLPIETIMKPVINLAKQGVIVTERQAKTIKAYQDLFRKANRNSIPLERPWKAGDTIKYPELAKTLERILQHGKDEFYKGKTAKVLADFIQKNGGIITEEDLSKYEAVWRKPLTFQYEELTVISMAPPSSGGVCLGQIMKSIEPFDVKELGHNSTPYIQLLSEAERRSYADRSHFLGDPDFVNIPQDSLISTGYLSVRMSNFSFDKATLSTDVSHGQMEVVESDETTHFSIVDDQGNAVAVTTTLNGAFGSKLYCPELGFFLNNEMDDFSSKPGTPNMFGLLGAEANAIAPEKRMLSSMTPTIVEKNGQLWMVVGTPGGSTIITSVLQTILNVYEFGMTMQEAVNAPRFHHQWLPDEIRMEPKGFSEDIKNQLEALGYPINESRSPVIGKVDGILILENGHMEGGADKRGDDTAVGY